MVTTQVTVTVCHMTRVTWGPWESKRIATVVKCISSREMSENSIEFSLSNSEQRDSWLNSGHRTLDADMSWVSSLVNATLICTSYGPSSPFSLLKSVHWHDVYVKVQWVSLHHSCILLTFLVSRIVYVMPWKWSYNWFICFWRHSMPMGSCWGNCYW